MAELTNHVTKLAMGQAHQIQHVQQISTCFEICGDGHMSNHCPLNPESIYYVGQQSRCPINQLYMGTIIIPIVETIQTSHGVVIRTIIELKKTKTYKKFHHNKQMRLQMIC